MSIDGGQHFIRFDVVRHGWQVYRVVNGIYRCDVGPAWPDCKDARRYCDALQNAPDVSPLRGSVEPLTGAPTVGGSTDSPRGMSAG